MANRDLLGLAAFWLFWPVWFLYLNGSVRTRVLIISGRKVLLVKEWHGGGKWGLPGGGVHKREPYKKSATREVYEETSLTLEPQKLKSLGPIMTKKGGIPFRILRYAIKIKKAEPVKPKSIEISKAEWIPMNKLDKNNTEPLVHQMITLWNKQR